MSVNIPNFFYQQYSSNVSMLLQQQGSKLRGTVMQGTHSGKQASVVDQIGSIEMQPVTGRFQPMGRVDAPLERRWAFPVDSDLPQLIDSFDKLKMLTDPTSAFVQNAVYAAGRQLDRQIIAALNGTAKTGETGSNSVILPASQQIANTFGSAGPATGLTVAKLREARRILMAANLDLDDQNNRLTCVVGANQHDSLLSEAQVTSGDFNDKLVLVEGKIARFLGIDFIHSELNQTSGATTFVPLYAKSGIYLGMWNDITATISKRHDLQGEPYQAYIYMSAGSTRLEEKRVVQIACN